MWSAKADQTGQMPRLIQSLPRAQAFHCCSIKGIQYFLEYVLHNYKLLVLSISRLSKLKVKVPLQDFCTMKAIRILHECEVLIEIFCPKGHSLASRGSAK